MVFRKAMSAFFFFSFTFSVTKHFLCKTLHLILHWISYQFIKYRNKYPTQTGSRHVTLTCSTTSTGKSLRKNIKVVFIFIIIFFMCVCWGFIKHKLYALSRLNASVSYWWRYKDRERQEFEIFGKVSVPKFSQPPFVFCFSLASEKSLENVGNKVKKINKKNKIRRRKTFSNVDMDFFFAHLSADVFLLILFK